MSKKLFSKVKISKGYPSPLGASVIDEYTVNLAFVNTTNKSCGVIIYDSTSKSGQKYTFSPDFCIGNVFSMRISGIKCSDLEYNFYIDDEIVPDPYSKKIIGNDIWGKIPCKLRNGVYLDDFEWENDKNPMIELNESVIYALHVRGFTKHKSSNVSKPATFEGVTEKTDYLKELGVNAVELMPSYNFVEYEIPRINGGEFSDNPFDEIEPKLNYWGYKDSFYFSPKQSYAYKGLDCVHSFKQMVKELHKAGIEVIMQFYFPDTVNRGYILRVIRFWTLEYHVDGFHLMGNKLPTALLGTDPLLCKTKLICESFPVDDIYSPGVIPTYKNLAVCRDDYMYDMRRLLKSDEGMAPKAISYMKDMPAKTGEIHYFSHCNTFTLYDNVSYDKKHNEENGEGNRDGAVYNASWNCGYEGPTSRKGVNKLRNKQLKNAIILNLLSKSTPLILSGDEFCNSQKGNNNPYCIDSPITWLNWNNTVKYKEIFDFTKMMIGFRKKYNILHCEHPFRMNDYRQCGYPDVSFHSEEPWRVETDPLSRQFGILYDGEYEGDKAFIYVAVNLHWTCHHYAIPKLPIGYKWKLFTSTDDGFVINDKSEIITDIEVDERSIVILIADCDE